MTTLQKIDHSESYELDVAALDVDYGKVRALRQVSLSLGKGEMALVLGPNGAGKSSLVGAVAGLVPAAAGTVLVAGHNVSRLAAHRRTRRGISLVPEGRGTLPGLSVEENLELGWRAGPRGSNAEHREARDRVLTLFPALTSRVRQDCSTLSGGEMQMLAIGRALLARPKVLLLDEPSLGLAPRAVIAVHEALRALSDDGLTMLLVEQKALTIDWVPQQTVVLRHGEVVFRGRNERPTQQQLSELYLGELAKEE